MNARTFHFRLHSHPTGSEPAAATLQLERQSETGSWEPLRPDLATPGFRLYLSAMLICLHYHLVAEARDRGLPLRAVEGRFSASTAADWALTDLNGVFLLKLEPGLERGEASSEEELMAVIRERMLHCPVFRNLDPAVPRTLVVQLER